MNKKRIIVFLLLLIMLFLTLNFGGVSIKLSPDYQYVVIVLPSDLSIDSLRMVNITVMSLTGEKTSWNLPQQRREHFRACYWGNNDQLWIDGEFGVIMHQLKDGEWLEYPITGMDEDDILFIDYKGVQGSISRAEVPKAIVKRLSYGEMPFCKEELTTQKHLDYYTQLIEETIFTEQYLGHHPTSKESGRRKTDIYLDSGSEDIIFLPQESEEIYKLSKYPNYERYSISTTSREFAEKFSDFKATDYEWVGEAVIDYEPESVYQLPELSEADILILNDLLDYIWEQYAMRQEKFTYKVYLGDFLKGYNEGMERISIQLAIVGDRKDHIYAELTMKEDGYDIWLYPSPFGLPDKSILDKESGNRNALENFVEQGYLIRELKK